MKTRFLFLLYISLSLMPNLLYAIPKRYMDLHSQHGKPDLVIIDGTDKVDPGRRVTVINKSVINHSTTTYSSVILVLAFYNEKHKLITTAKTATYNLAPSKTWKIAVPVSFLGNPAISEYEVLSLSGVKAGKSVVSYKLVPNDGRFHFRPALLDATLEATINSIRDTAADPSAFHYVGPTVDSLFTNPDLVLLQADFTPGNQATDAGPSPDGTATLTGVIENISSKNCSYVELDANAYD